MKKLNLSLLCGGKSPEHEISLLSARSVFQAIDKEKYNISIIGISKDGTWHLGSNENIWLNSDDPKKIHINEDLSSVNLISLNGECVIRDESQNDVFVDIVFPVMHGAYGEDGKIQGFLETVGVKYVGSDLLSSAICMDKDITNRLLKEAGVLIPKFQALYKSDQNFDLDQLISELGLPLFVKPANLGSSIGVSKVKNRDELKKAISLAFEYDKKVLIEEFIEGRELEVSVLGNENPVCSVVGEIIPNHEFYSYEAKYLDENGAEIITCADIPENINKEIQTIALKAFRTLECSGMARVDFFLSNDGKVYLNELNTIPGFTKISMYPKLFEASGIQYPELIDKLINLGLDRVVM